MDDNFPELMTDNQKSKIHYKLKTNLAKNKVHLGISKTKRKILKAVRVQKEKKKTVRLTVGISTEKLEMRTIE